MTTTNTLFRKKPVVIEARQWTGENADEIQAFLCPHNPDSGYGWVKGSYVDIRTPKGLMAASIGDWIVRTPDVSFYPVKPDIFAATYEPAAAATAPAVPAGWRLVPIEPTPEMVGAMYDHEEDRGVFFFPDHAEPEEAETYDAVIAAVGSLGKFIAFGNAAGMGAMNELLADPQALMQQVFGAMGIDDPSAILAAMQGGDPEALKLAQIQMTGALERAMQQAGPLPVGSEADGEDEDEEDEDPQKK